MTKSLVTEPANVILPFAINVHSQPVDSVFENDDRFASAGLMLWVR